MIEFQVSAPGKVILFGEHSVVYGKTAVAASLDLRTNLFFKEKHEFEDKICIKFPMINHEFSIVSEKVQNFFFEIYESEALKVGFNFHKHVEKFVEDYASLPGEAKEERFSKLALFYLLFRTFSQEKVKVIPSFEIEVNSELKIGSGLGSSASFAVCLATCFSQYCQLVQKKSPKLDQSRLEEISEKAFECEKIMHGSPSGIDNMICTFGSMLKFSKKESMTLIPCTKDFKVMLVDSKAERSTKTMVESVSLRNSKYPELLGSIFQAMDVVAKKAVELISKDSDEMVLDYYHEISELIRFNQGLLYACGVSSPSLDTICATARECGFAAKLTGAGGGGYAYAFISQFAEEDVNKLSEALRKTGFTTTVTTLGGPGVRIH